MDFVSPAKGSGDAVDDLVVVPSIGSKGTSARYPYSSSTPYTALDPKSSSSSSVKAEDDQFDETEVKDVRFPAPRDASALPRAEGIRAGTSEAGPVIEYGR